ncbi:MAG: HTH domain-containing protein [Succinivibrio sp.]|nr:HTH domain-containing protein [Succinivibrio sp.]
MKSSPKITIVNLAEVLNVSRRTIQRDLESLRNSQKIRRDGDDHGGTWQVL